MLDLIDQKDIPFGLNQAKKEIELLEIIYEKDEISVSRLAHISGKYTGEIDVMLKDIESYGLIKIIQHKDYKNTVEETVGLAYKHVILTDTGREFGKLLEFAYRENNALQFIRAKDTFIVEGDIAEFLGIEDDKDIIHDLEMNGILGYHDHVYWLSNIGERLADLLK